jgi:hypothetical protein
MCTSHCYAALAKVFDNVVWNKMFRKLGMDYNNRRAIYQVYKKHVATMKLRDGRHIGQN